MYCSVQAWVLGTVHKHPGRVLHIGDSVCLLGCEKCPSDYWWMKAKGVIRHGSFAIWIGM